MRNIAILGATGSIGMQTINIIENNPDMFKLVAISVGENIELANEILNKFDSIKCISVKNECDIKKINKDIKVVYGLEGLINVATYNEVDVVVTAVVGSVGLLPTIEAIKNKKTIALANKETLVTAGHIIMPLAKEYDVKILPVDSEHSAIFQCLNGEDKTTVNKIILTASGGSFRDKTKEELNNVKVEDALNHPNWSMGKKITIDSATMFNKGLEVIEAHYLFDVDYDDIEVIIHKESIIHSMVEFIDTSVIAQMGNVDMRCAIAYALTYPKREVLKDSGRLDLRKIGQLNFLEVDLEKYPAIKLAYKAGRMGGSILTVFNTANEIAVELFLKEKISFVEISKLVEKEMDDHNNIINPSLEEILSLDKDLRNKYKGVLC